MKRRYRLLVLSGCCLLFLSLTAGYVYAGLPGPSPILDPTPGSTGGTLADVIGGSYESGMDVPAMLAEVAPPPPPPPPPPPAVEPAVEEYYYEYEEEEYVEPVPEPVPEPAAPESVPVPPVPEPEPCPPTPGGG